MHIEMFYVCMKQSQVDSDNYESGFNVYDWPGAFENLDGYRSIYQCKAAQFGGSLFYNSKN